MFRSDTKVTNRKVEVAAGTSFSGSSLLRARTAAMVDSFTLSWFASEWERERLLMLCAETSACHVCNRM